jgi:AAA+ superfamily predicted ATPase
LQNHFQNIIYSLDFLHEVVNRRLQSFFSNASSVEFVYPELHILDDDAPLNNLLFHDQLNIEEYTTLLLALTPHLQPNFFESIIQVYLPNGGDFLEIGGVKGVNHRGMLPTGETVQFILAGNDLQKRMEVQQMLSHGRLIKENIIWLESVKEGEPYMSGRLVVAQEYIDIILFGIDTGIKFSNDFPAKKVTTAMTWADLVLNHYTQNQIKDIMTWMEHNPTILKDEILQRKIKPGYRVLFCGPSGTGKTLTATLIGKQLKKDVYRIDLSQVVSKYIGETEKNLEKIFSKAEHKDWILFFDEADALFGKRTTVQNSHDRYANQEVSYLLQRVEDYPGLIILASNFKSNMDEAFLRRFHSIIHFPIPGAGERLKLWQKTLPAGYKPEPAINLQELSEKYELNGAAILNIVHYVSLKSISRNDELLRYNDIIEAIRKEFRKEERSIN